VGHQRIISSLGTIDIGWSLNSHFTFFPLLFCWVCFIYSPMWSIQLLRFVFIFVLKGGLTKLKSCRMSTLTTMKMIIMMLKLGLVLSLYWFNTFFIHFAIVFQISVVTCFTAINFVILQLNYYVIHIFSCIADEPEL